MTLVEKYRPQSFGDIAGLEDIKKYFSSVDKKDYLPEKDFAHKYVFCGPYGCGKTSVSRLLGDKLNCTIVELNAGSETGVDAARNLIQQLDRASLFNRPTLYIIDEAHQLSSSAQNALLKPVEDNLVRDYLILCTTNPAKILKGLKDRCVVFDFKKLTEIEAVLLLKRIVSTENKEVDGEILAHIAENCQGSARVAVQMLDKYLHTNDLESVLGYAVFEDPEILQLYLALWSKEKSTGDVLQLLREIKEEPESIRIGLVNMFNSTFLKQTSSSPKCVQALKVLSQYGQLINPDRRALLNVVLYEVKELLRK